jgi:hypothetical protein
VTGSCHCGLNEISLSRRPSFLYSCNCSLCLKSGGLWGYFAAADVSVAGETASYRQSTKTTKGTLHFCGQCGSTTQWRADIDAGEWTCAINMRLFDAADLAGLPIHYPDGANWSGVGPFGFVCDPTVHNGISH